MSARDTATGVDVRRFGAQGDGVNDDSAAIQAALDQLALAGGGRGSALLFPPGVYLIANGKTVTIPVNMPDGLVILGTGDDVVLQLGSDPAVANHTFFVVPDGVSATFRNLRFGGPVAGLGWFLTAVYKAGTTGRLCLSSVTAANPANALVQVEVGCQFLLEATAEVGVDVALQATTPAILTHQGEGLWTGNSQPRQIKGVTDPSAGAGVAAPEGSTYQQFVVGAGQLWVKTGAAATAWTPGGGVGGLAANVRLPTPVAVPGTRVILYARLTGNDTTGDGSLANPYRTFFRALADVPVFLSGVRYVIDISGLGNTVVPADGYALPPFISSDNFVYNFAAEYPLYFVEFPLNINATPTTLATITAGQIVSQIPDPETGMPTLKTTGGFVPNAYKGKQIVGAGFFEVGVIASNTATDFEICTSGTFTAPITIVEPSASFSGGTPGSYQGMFKVNIDCPLSINGIHFSTPGGLGDVGFEFDGHARLEGFLNRITGADWSGGPEAFFQTFGMVFDGEEWVASGSAGQTWYSYFEGVTDYRVYGDGAGAGMYHSQCIFHQCQSIGPQGNDGHTGGGSWGLSFSKVRQSLSIGVLVQIASGKHRIWSSIIENCAGDGISIIGQAYVTFIGGSGVGNGGVGIRAIDGAQVLIDASTSVTGAGGDMKIGGLPVRTYVNFRTIAPIKNEADFFVPATSDGSRLHQP
jgi:hypothetical protein